MERISMMQFRQKVDAAADQMIKALDENNQKYEASEGAYTLEDLRPRFVAYFRRLLSGEYEIRRPTEEEQEQEVASVSAASAPSRYRS